MMNLNNTSGAVPATIPPIKMERDFNSESYQSGTSIQLRTHPTHATINFSELGKKLLESARNGDTEDVIDLITNGAPFSTDWLGASPLHYAAQYGHVDTVETLLRSGIAKDARTKIERTALHVAAQEGFLEVVNLLVSYGCDVDAKDMLKMTPLHWAVQRGHRLVAEVLLNNGADVRLMNKFDKTPIEIAYSSGRDDMVPLLQNYKGKAKPKITPVDTPIPFRVTKQRQKSHSKSANANRNANKMIKQEINDDDDMVVDTSHSTNKMKKESMANGGGGGQASKMSNIGGEGGAPAGKFILHQAYTPSSDSPGYHNNDQNMNMNLSTPKNDSGNGGPAIKVMKKQLYTDLKNSSGKANPIQVPFFNAKSGTPHIIKRYVINPPAANQTSQVTAMQDEIKRLNEEVKQLKRELQNYKELIISKDLELERVKKRKISESRMVTVASIANTEINRLASLSSSPSSSDSSSSSSQSSSSNNNGKSPGSSPLVTVAAPPTNASNSSSKANLDNTTNDDRTTTSNSPDPGNTSS